MQEKWVEFAIGYEALVGKAQVPANLRHMGCHFMQTISAHGPVPAHWLFAFERMNGVVGREFNSGRMHSVCKELLRKRVERQHFSGLLESWMLYTDSTSKHAKDLLENAVPEMSAKLKESLSGRLSNSSTYTRMLKSTSQLIRGHMKLFSMVDVDNFVEREWFGDEPYFLWSAKTITRMDLSELTPEMVGDVNSFK